MRSDITKSFGDASGTAEGVQTTVDLTLLDVSGGGKPLAGAAVYLWHCDMEGRYSMYDQEIASENYLRGVQESDGDGRLSLHDDLPGGLLRALAAHPLRGLREHRRGHLGRLEAAGPPRSRCRRMRARSSTRPAGYEQSVQNLAQTSLDTDMVFSDGYAGQLASWSGSPDKGIALKLNVGV